MPLAVCERSEYEDKTSPYESRDLSVLLCLRPVVSEARALDVTIPLEDFDLGRTFPT